ncbi:MAG: Mini-ribonuclease 3 [Culicoidibacterales bacterium]
MEAKLLNGIALAYMGDACFDLIVREHLLQAGITKPQELQRRAVQFVSAKAQNKIVQTLIEMEQLTPDEYDIYRRGRNAQSHTKPKNCDVQTYRRSTGFEAIFGYLYLTKQTQRLQILGQKAIEIIESGENNE